MEIEKLEERKNTLYPGLADLLPVCPNPALFRALAPHCDDKVKVQE